MPRFLVTLSLGPVQSLIADARRTRDLWSGSWLLSEAARAAGRFLHSRHRGCLIFPCLDEPDQELKPQDATGESANIANILRADVKLADSDAVLRLCNEAKSAASVRVKELGEAALRRLGLPVRDEVWRAQIDDILEVFAAWVEIRDSGDYAAAGKRLIRALHERKATRDFRPCRPLPDSGLPKSSLDGARETVLPAWPAGERARTTLVLTSGEQLDALGVIKRLAGDPDQFTAWPRIAADSWVEQLTPDQQQRLRAACEELAELQLATPVRGNGRIYEALPFDGHLLYRARLARTLMQEPTAGAERAPSRRIRALEALRKCITSISHERTDTGRRAGEPVPYAAVLKADGDRMGRLLSCAERAEDSRAISRLLRKFAADARRIVRNRRGHAIYAGGDDVLALVPLVHALHCARELADAFRESLHGIAEQMQLPADEHPTLSVGLGIGYVIEPLGALRARAERAERHAKSNATSDARNALAVRLGIRSGAELRWRAQWSDKPAFDALDRFTRAYRTGELPSRVAYDVRSIDRRLAWLRGCDDDTARGMRKAEIERMLDRARREGGRSSISAELQTLVRERAGSRTLGQLAAELVIARWLAARTAADLGEDA